MAHASKPNPIPGKVAAAMGCREDSILVSYEAWGLFRRDRQTPCASIINVGTIERISNDCYAGVRPVLSAKLVSLLVCVAFAPGPERRKGSRGGPVCDAAGKIWLSYAASRLHLGLIC